MKACHKENRFRFWISDIFYYGGAGTRPVHWGKATFRSCLPSLRDVRYDVELEPVLSLHRMVARSLSGPIRGGWL